MSNNRIQLPADGSPIQLTPGFKNRTSIQNVSVAAIAYLSSDQNFPSPTPASGPFQLPAGASVDLEPACSLWASCGAPTQGKEQPVLQFLQCVSNYRPADTA